MYWWILLLISGLVAQSADPNPSRFQTEITHFAEWDKKNSVPDNAILFVGSSSIRMWTTALYFPNEPIINRGFGGAHISDILYFYDQTVKKYAPAKIFFYAGDNDVTDGKPSEQVLNDYQKFVELVQTDFPQTQIFFLSIKPSISRWKFWPEMAKANETIKQYAESETKLFYIDVATGMLNNFGEPNPGYFSEDGLHLNQLGYQLWVKTISPYLEKP